MDAKARFLRPAKFNDMAEIASEISRFGRSSFDVQHRISIDGELAVEGSETRVWATQDPDDATRLRGLPIPAEVIGGFRWPSRSGKFPIAGLAKPRPVRLSSGTRSHASANSDTLRACSVDV